MKQWFNKRDLLIATMHKKEQVIAPLLEKHLGVNCIVPTHFDTDQLGTFSGEINRESDALTTARKKCEMAMEMFDCDLVLASEGSFGMHPTAFFIPADFELLLLVDKRNMFEVKANLISAATNFFGEEIKSLTQLLQFCEKVGFPEHAIILKDSKENFTEIVKGIHDPNQLEQCFEKLIKISGTVYAETDMRALHNPGRMTVIKQTTEKLIENINSMCPKCGTPGFIITRTVEGLPCANCRFPTKGIIAEVSECQKCNFIKEHDFPGEKYFEDPMYCNFCNP